MLNWFFPFIQILYDIESRNLTAIKISHILMYVIACDFYEIRMIFSNRAGMTANQWQNGKVEVPGIKHFACQLTEPSDGGQLCQDTAPAVCRWLPDNCQGDPGERRLQHKERGAARSWPTGELVMSMDQKCPCPCYVTDIKYCQCPSSRFFPSFRQPRLLLLQKSCKCPGQRMPGPAYGRFRAKQSVL